MENWWQYLLHTHRAYRIRSTLRKYGEPPLVLMNIPWHLGEPEKSTDLEDLEASTHSLRKAHLD